MFYLKFLMLHFKHSNSYKQNRDHRTDEIDFFKVITLNFPFPSPLHLLSRFRYI